MTMSKPLEIGTIIQLVCRDIPDRTDYTIFAQVRPNQFQLIGLDGNAFSFVTFGTGCTIQDLRNKYSDYWVYTLTIDLYDCCENHSQYINDTVDKTLDIIKIEEKNEQKIINRLCEVFSNEHGWDISTSLRRWVDWDYQTKWGKSSLNE